jgi:DNA-binding IclR family transcriptional regulator
MPKTDIYYIEVLGKALNILDVFVQAQKPRLSLQELSKASGLNKNTVFRVL